MLLIDNDSVQCLSSPALCGSKSTTIEEADHSGVFYTDIPPRLEVQEGLLSGNYVKAKKL